MKIKKIGVALVAALALSAFSAGMAQASSPGHWKVNGSVLGAGVEETVNAHKVNSETALTLSSELGVALTATGIECVECKIYNDGTAHSSGKLRFTGVSVEAPEGCQVSSSTLETKALTDEVIMSGTESFDLFYPQEGSTFVQIKITECAIAGKYNVTGTVAGRSPNATGEELTEQVLQFNGTSTAGSALALGGKGAFLMGEVGNTLASGNAFGAEAT